MNLDKLALQNYLTLKRQYNKEYNVIFAKVTTQTAFQNANNKQRIDILRKARYAFLLHVNSIAEIHNIEILFPLCFTRLEQTKVLELQFVPDSKKFVYNPYKN